MEKFNYETALKFYAEEAVAALYWCENPQVLVDKENHEVDWLDTEAKKTAEFLKDLYNRGLCRYASW